MGRPAMAIAVTATIAMITAVGMIRTYPGAAAPSRAAVDREQEVSDAPEVCFYRLDSNDGDGTDTTGPWSVRVDGSNLRRLEQFRRGPCPEWAPDGQTVAYAAPPKRGADFEIYIANNDGSGVRRLTDNRIDDVSPIWSPDGTSLVFARNRRGFTTSLHVMSVEESDVTRIGAGYPRDWSPDGAKILFDRGTDMYQVAPDGSAMQRLSPEGSRFAWGDGEWSPDGRFIVFVKRRVYNCGGEPCGHTRLAILDTRDSITTSLIEERVIDIYEPTWVPDGSEILYVWGGRPYLIDSEGNNKREMPLDVACCDDFTSPMWVIRPASE